MMLWDNIKIFVTLKFLYAYLGIGFLILPFIYKTQYDNILSMIGFFGCLILFNIELIRDKLKVINNG